MRAQRQLVDDWLFVDWTAVAQGVADVVERPVFGVDATGRIVLVNGALERMVGWRRDEVLGRCWTASIIAPAPDAPDALVGILRGDVRTSRLVLRSSTGARRVVTVGVRTIGLDDARAVIVVIEAVERLAVTPSSPGKDDWMEVSMRAEDRGVVVRAPSATLIGKQCSDAVTVRASACDRCPVRKPQEGPPTAGHTLVHNCTDGRLMMVRTRRTEVDTVIVWHELLEGLTAADVARGQLDDLADHHQLSTREREVLDHLMLGASLDHIAQALGISARTVKFHQANLLDKLGLVSRCELPRMLVGEPPLRPPVPPDR